EQDAAVVGSEADGLSEEGAEGRAGLDDGAFRAKGAAGADGEGGGERLEEGDADAHAAVAEEDSLHGFGDAVSFEGGLPVVDHDADDQAADGGDENDPEAEVVVGGVG